MKRAGLLFLLVALVLVELILLEGFVPYGWPHPVSGMLNRILPTQEYKPHPNMDLEIEMVLRQHHTLRIVFYVLTGISAVGNALLISKTWKVWRRSKPPSSRT